MPFFYPLNLITPNLTPIPSHMEMPQGRGIYLYTIMKKSIILSIFLSFLTLSCLAMPAKRVRKCLTLEDGTQVSAVLTGDEHGHWFVDDQGNALVEDSTGVAHYLSSASLSRRREARNERLTIRNNSRKARLARAGNVTRGASNTTYTGKKKGLILLVNFKDKKFTYSKDDFIALANEKGYNKNGAKGSVTDYFRDQSYGEFDLTFDVMGPYELSRMMSYYGRNVDNNQGEDAMVGEMVTEAVKLADKDVNFSNYDWNHDGEVDQVYIVYAGYSEQEGAPSSTIWSHEWDLESAKFYGNGGNGPVRLDNVNINTYACSSEMKGSRGNVMSGIGTFCHEFSHCLGLPDLYDTRNTYVKNFGMDAWSVLDYGSYNGDGAQPCGFTSWERWQTGWLTPVELVYNTSITDMKPVNETPEAYVIYNDTNRDEYYMLENRQLTSWDAAGYGHGLLILHVDYKLKNWEDNTINNDPVHQRLTIFHADNDAFSTTLSGDPYPGTSKKTSLTDFTLPPAKTYTANKNNKFFMNKPITNIAESADGLISFNFSNPNAPTSIDNTELSVPQTKYYNLWGRYMGSDAKRLPQGAYKVKSE